MDETQSIGIYVNDLTDKISERVDPREVVGQIKVPLIGCFPYCDLKEKKKALEYIAFYKDALERGGIIQEVDENGLIGNLPQLSAGVSTSIDRALLNRIIKFFRNNIDKYGPEAKLYSGKTEIAGLDPSQMIYFLGRGEDNDIVVDEKAVSERHGKFFYENGRLFYQNLGRNGTGIVAKKDQILLKDGKTRVWGDYKPEEDGVCRVSDFLKCKLLLPAQVGKEGLSPVKEMGSVLELRVLS